jgi:uncharacterized protein (TIGR00645 family)
MRRFESGFQSVIYYSRWLIAPFLVGLICCVVLLIYRFFADFFDAAKTVYSMTWHELVVVVLNLVDVTLTANLVLIVIFAGYENFVQRLEMPPGSRLPEGLTGVDFNELKQKLLGSIAVIAAVDALAWYLDLEKYPDTSKLVWAIGFPVFLVLALLMLAAADRLGRHSSE